MSIILLLLQTAFSACMAYSCFCRMVRTDAETVREVRLAIWFQGVAAGLVLGAPLLPLLMHEIQWQAGTTPTWIWLVLLLASALIQVVTSRYWRNGVPPDFQKGNP